MIFFAPRCPNHFFKSAINMCHLCEEIFCNKCIVERESVYFCKLHFDLVQECEWILFREVMTDSDSPELGTEIYNLKILLWEKYKIPSYFKTTHNVSEDREKILSRVEFYIPKDQEEEISKVEALTKAFR